MSLDALRAIIQQDIGNRGLATVPEANLFTARAADFADACRSIAETPRPRVGILTGFAIPVVDPIVGETDGPLGALFLAWAFETLGIPALLISDRYTLPALRFGLDHRSLSTPLLDSPRPQEIEQCTHLISIERVGPAIDGHCYTMRGRDVTNLSGTMHRLVTDFPGVTIGIGDGGNEIGMGAIPEAVIATNVPMGERIACRIPTDFLIVAGVSNWAGYSLAAGVAIERHTPLPPNMFDPEPERELLRQMIEAGLLVDGVTGQPTVTVDGLAFDTHAEVLRSLARIAERGNA